MNHRLFSLFRREDAPALAWTILVTLFVGILFSLPPQSLIFTLGSHSTGTATAAHSPAPTVPQPAPALLCFASQRVGAALRRPLGLCGRVPHMPPLHVGSWVPLNRGATSLTLSPEGPTTNLRSGRSSDRFPAPPRRLCAGALGFLFPRGTAIPRCALGSSPTAPRAAVSLFPEPKKAPPLRTANNWASTPEELFLSITKEANP
jgi:hypothetical protein